MMLIQTPGLVPRLRAFGCLLVGASEPLSCVPLLWRRMPPHVRSARLLQLPPLAPPALRGRAPTRIPWRMFIRQSTLSVQRPMPHWRLSSTTVATREEEGNLIRKAGVMGIVLASGEVQTGDVIGIELPQPPYRPLERV